jgi:NADH:ubiquinone oxidoreductase subunit 4 (subunit M)
MVVFLYLLPILSIIHLFLVSIRYVRTVALFYSLFTFVYASFLWYIAEFDSNNLSYLIDLRLEFGFPIHYFSAIDSISFCFILLSLLLYSALHFSFVGVSYCKNKGVL